MQESIRDEAIRQFLAGAHNICNFDDVSIGLKALEWKVHPVTFQGQVIGAILEKNGEFHTSIAPSYQKLWNPRPYIRNILYPALEQLGKIYTSAKKEDIRAQRWITKIGFQFLEEDVENIYYVLRNKKF